MAAVQADLTIAVHTPDAVPRIRPVNFDNTILFPASGDQLRRQLLEIASIVKSLLISHAL